MSYSIRALVPLFFAPLVACTAQTSNTDSNSALRVQDAVNVEATDRAEDSVVIDSPNHALADVTHWTAIGFASSKHFVVRGINDRDEVTHEVRFSTRRDQNGAPDGIVAEVVSPEVQRVELSANGEIVFNSLAIGGESLDVIAALATDVAQATASPHLETESVQPPTVGEWLKAHVNCIGSVAGAVGSCVGAVASCGVGVGVACVSSGSGCISSVTSAITNC